MSSPNLKAIRDWCVEKFQAKGNYLTSVPEEYVTAAELEEKVSTTGHAHDDRYYTENEIDTKFSDVNIALGNKSPTGHTHGAMSTITYATEEPTSLAVGEIVMVYEE